MKDTFGLFKVKAGVAGKVSELPPMEVLHQAPLTRPTWIDYAALDAKVTA